MKSVKTNAITTTEDCALIHLSKGFTAMVDPRDVAIVSMFKWSPHVKPGRSAVYAFASVDGSTIYLHRLLTNAKPGLVVDHRNLDGLDCRRSNMRLVTNQQNVTRCIKRKPSSSRFKGVSWDESRGKWVAKAMKNRRGHYAGRYATEEEAARAYNAKAVELFGEFAILNEVE